MVPDGPGTGPLSGIVTSDSTKSLASDSIEYTLFQLSWGVHGTVISAGFSALPVVTIRHR